MSSLLCAKTKSGGQDFPTQGPVCLTHDAPVIGTSICARSPICPRQRINFFTYVSIFVTSPVRIMVRSNAGLGRSGGSKLA